MQVDRTNSNSILKFIFKVGIFTLAYFIIYIVIGKHQLFHLVTSKLIIIYIYIVMVRSDYDGFA